MRKTTLYLITTYLTYSLAVISNAGVAFQECSPINSAPNYFSGTNCRAHYSAELTGLTVHIAEVKMSINGEEIYHELYPWSNNPKAPKRRRVDPLIIWDSTHFPDGTNAIVSIDVWTTDDGVNLSHYADSYSATIKNLAVGFARNDPGWPDTSILFTNLMSTINYSILREFSAPWDSSYIQFYLNGANTYDINTHGYPNEHLTNVDLPTPGYQVFFQDYWLWRQNQVGNGGLPPYNNGEPPINFAHFQACLCGENGNFNHILEPFVNAYGSWTENQAIFAYKHYIYVDEGALRTNTLYGMLSNGYTVVQARDNLITVATQSITGTSDPVPLTINDAPIYGDWHTRISDVYTGSNAISLDSEWFEVIQ